MYKHKIQVLKSLTIIGFIFSVLFLKEWDMPYVLGPNPLELKWIYSIVIMAIEGLTALVIYFIGYLVEQGWLFGGWMHYSGDGWNGKKWVGLWKFPVLLLLYGGLLFLFIKIEEFNLPMGFYFSIVWVNICAFLLAIKLESFPPIFNMFNKE